MKYPTLLGVATLALALAQPALAADPHGDHQHHAMAMGTSQAEAALADGTVKKVDKSASKLTVAHGPLPNGMPAMTMAYRVKDPVMLGQMKSGDRIRFAAENVNNDWVITRIESAR